jgi:hypothetical protein
MRTYHVAWWNLENLVDEENAVALGRRTDKVFRAIKDDIAGWTPQLRDRNIDQLALVIAAMNTGQGPGPAGVCEIENRFVIDRLIERVNATLPAPRSYAVVHTDTGDAVESMSRSSTTTPCCRFPHLPGVGVLRCRDVPPSHARDCPGQVQNHHSAHPDLGLFGNHWPSRSGGQFESAGYAPLPDRRFATSTSACSRCTGRRRPCSRWGLQR